MTKAHTVHLTRLDSFFEGHTLSLRVSILANLFLLAALAFTFSSLHTLKTTVASWRPVVIRVNEAGVAVPIDLTTIESPSTELEARVFASNYITQIQSYDPHTLNQDLALALNCTSPECARQLVQHFQQSKDLQELKKTGTVLNCTVKAVQIITAPGSTQANTWQFRVDYVLTNFQTQSSRNWFALLTATNCTRSFANPFGLSVTGVRINTTVN